MSAVMSSDQLQTGNRGISVGEMMRQGAHRLREHGIETARLDARVLAMHVFALGESALMTSTGGVGVAKAAQYQACVERRLQGEPISHIIGRREFWSLDFRVDSSTLAPRPDSESLIAGALRYFTDKDTPLRILDLGTGTGCLLLSLLSEYPHAQGVGVDRSRGALGVAMANARAHNLATRSQFINAHWTTALGKTFDLIVCNPPYLSHEEWVDGPRELSFEPRSALVGGTDGLDAYRELIPEIEQVMNRESVVIFEIGMTQERAVSELLLAAGFGHLDVLHDLGGRSRGIVARLPRLEAS